MNRKRLVDELRKKDIVVVRDLATAAGVDPSTVSRALRYDPRISEKRAKLIRELADEVGYRPRPLRTRKTQAIGLIVATSSYDRPDEEYLERIAWLVQRVVREHDFHVHLECVLRKPGAAVPQVPAVIRENRVDGILLAGHPPAQLVEELRRCNLPMVGINDSPRRLGIPCVRTEPGPAIHEVVLKLAAWGHDRFAVLLSNLEYPAIAARHQSCRDALRDVGLTLDEAHAVTGLDEGIGGGYTGIGELAQCGEMPSAIICCNDWVALGALQKLQQLGYRVPEDVSLVGHDDLSFCRDVDPSLTSCARPERDLVSSAMTILLDEMVRTAEEPEVHLVRSSVVWRASTGLAARRRRR